MFQIGCLYFGLVFAAGFGLGIIRILWLVPLLGNRWAELLEMPVMLAVIVWAAQWLVQQKGLASRSSLYSLGIGMLGLVLVVTADMGVGIGLRGMTFTQDLFNRDPISGTAYYLMLVIFALMPWLWVQRLQGSD